MKRKTNLNCENQTQKGETVKIENKETLMQERIRGEKNIYRKTGMRRNEGNRNVTVETNPTKINSIIYEIKKCE